ncbi:hypothetical protein [Variovorax paradoxus]|uniref:hypothetical protein n=1 Tax=Variovorax paradoxus TaxID=34073 RepID=UPI003ED065AD
MATSKFHTIAGLRIPRGMVWVDEFKWSAVSRASSRSVTGALLLDGALKKKGRPITLQAEPDAGWIDRADLQAIQDLADADPFAPLVLTLADGRTFTVQFAPVETPVEGDTVGRPELPATDSPYVAVVRLITV